MKFSRAIIGGLEIQEQVNFLRSTDLILPISPFRLLASNSRLNRDGFNQCFGILAKNPELDRNIDEPVPNLK